MRKLSLITDLLLLGAWQLHSQNFLDLDNSVASRNHLARLVVADVGLGLADRLGQLLLVHLLLITRLLDGDPQVVRHDRN